MLASLVWAWCLPAAQAADLPLTPAEERGALEAVEELGAARSEITTLKNVLQKDSSVEQSLRTQISTLERLSDLQEKMLQTALKIQTSQDQLVESYRKMAAIEVERANKAEARAERAEAVSKWAGPIGLIVGIAATAALAVFVK